MKILVTGTAGFIGSHVALRLLERGDEVIGIDNLSDYYDVELKKARLARFSDHPAYRHELVDLADRAAIEAVFARHTPQRVINLAAYDRIPERLLQLPWARRLLGPARLARIADYVGNNLGALAGNFLFGVMLGGVTALGVLFGLPLDIRHIAFSSAHTAYAIASLDFAVGWRTVAVAALGVGLIGVVNLTVSFALALWVALRARQVSFAQGRALIGMVLKALLTRSEE